jgi:PAS domain S-box-containing protein
MPFSRKVGPVDSSSARRRGLSLDVKLPLLISSLLFAVLAVGVLLGYRGVRASAEGVAEARLKLISEQLSAILAPSIDQGVARLRTGARSPAALSFLTRPDAASERAARSLLEGVRTPTTRTMPVALLDRNRAPLLVLVDSVRGDSVSAFSRDFIPSAEGMGPFFESGKLAHFWIVSPVQRGKEVVGYVAEMGRLGGGSTAKQIQALIGNQISVFFADTVGGRWVTLDGEFVQAPKSWPFAGADQYPFPGSGQHLGYAAAVPRSPFAMVAEQPLAEVLAEPRKFLRESALAALLLSILGAFGAWILSRRITEPVRELREASEAIARGEYEHRVRVTRKDEFGALGEAFNWLADYVRSTHGSLTEQFETEHSKVAELERSKRVEAELAEGRIRDILDSMSDMFFALDRDMRFKHVNAAAERMLGEKSRAGLGNVLWELYPSLKDSPLYHACVGALKDGEARDVEQPAQLSPGLWYQFHVVPTSDGVAVFTRDITERREAETMVKTMSAAVEASADGICILSSSGILQYANRAEAELHGYENPNELVGQPWTSFFSAEEAAKIVDLWRSATTGSDRWVGESIGKRRDGSTFPQEFSITRLEGIGFVGVQRDISERKAAERALQESEKMVRQLTDNVETVLWMKSWPDGAFLHLSAAYERIWGRSIESAYQESSSWTEAIHPDDRGRVAAAVSTQERGYDEEYRILGPGSEIRWIHDRAYPIRADDGQVYRVAGFAEDISERKQVEEALRAARTEAERANRSKSEFLSRMSHELRTPMNAILGFAQLLEMDVQGSEEQESTHQILRAGRHLLRLIDEVLDLAKIEAEQVSMSVEPVLVQRVLQEALDLVRPMAAERGIRLYGEASDFCVAADQHRLNQVLLNLLSNAIKYNREEGEVRVSCERRAGDRVRIRVSDTGRGISSSVAERVFRPFDRLGAERTEVQGTGLGLALSKGLTEAMSGTIGFESQEGEGTTFWIELAGAIEVTEQLSMLEAAQDAPEDPASPPGSEALTVLYIEDNLSNLHLVERILRRRPDVKLIPAMQGRLGLELAQRHRPDLILLDLHLPDINGEEVLASLRADPELAGIPVVVISADATERQIQKLRDAGARDYLTKPFEVQRLLAVIDAVMQEDGVE